MGSVACRYAQRGRSNHGVWPLDWVPGCRRRAIESIAVALGRHESRRAALTRPKVFNISAAINQGGQVLRIREALIPQSEVVERAPVLHSNRSWAYHFSGSAVPIRIRRQRHGLD